MRMKKFFIGFLCLLGAKISNAQEYFPTNGIRDLRPELYAFINANIVTQPGKTIQNGILLIEKGKVLAVGSTVVVPKDAIVVDLKNKWIYPAFIDPFSKYGMPSQSKGPRNESPQHTPSRKGVFGANDAIKSDTKASMLFKIDEKQASKLREAGFGTVITHMQDGIARGTSSLVFTGNGSENEMVLLPEIAANYSFNKGSSIQDYPSSLMGSIALLRQTFYDAKWYSQNQKSLDFIDISLQSMNDASKMLQVFEGNAKYDPLRVSKLGKEFGIDFIVKGTGDEYQYTDELKANKLKLIVPINFPEATDVEDAFDALGVSLQQAKNWEFAPQNPKILKEKNIPFCLTSAGIDSPNDWLSKLRKAVEVGLSLDAALEAVTTSPAEMFKVSSTLGKLEVGYFANFLVTDSAFLSDKKAKLYQTWVKGAKYEHKSFSQPSLEGKYTVSLNGFSPFKITIKGSDAPEITATTKDTVKIKATIKQDQTRINLTFESPDTLQKGTIRMVCVVDGYQWSGIATLPNGSTQAFLTMGEFFSKKDTASKADKKPEIRVYSSRLPIADFGLDSLPKSESVLFRNATVWTNTGSGIMSSADVWVQNGKIKAVGKNISATDAHIVDATNMHLTPGIIDEHSHIAISRGVNEGTRSVTSEVRIGDVLNPDDINIYRQLAGGVTTSHLLHGSANAIGGQTQLIKLRWGVTDPEKLKFEGADGFIKFALGENVKQSNWGDRQSTRFPQTRMGVEQVIFDGFTRAKEYDALWSKYTIAGKSFKGLVPRRDLTLDALSEILKEKRFITCHSYVQSEINMLMKAADSMGFKVNTFTHILEGYKVADKMKAHGAAASTFADWWAYKYEVIDAIPYNAAILTKMGVLTGINSDDAEMARRLNQEAAKTIKYGGLTEEEAFKLVTLNPAKMLHIDNRVGSIEAGKDADLVLWNNHPLSVYAKPLQTWIEGACYFDIQRDEFMQKRDATDKNYIIQQMIKAKKEGSSTKKPTNQVHILYHCDDVGF